jgi:hypothetical protein
MNFFYIDISELSNDNFFFLAEPNHFLAPNKNFAKELGAFETYIKNRQNPINFDKDDFSHILKFIPQQFLNDQEIQNFLEANMKEINYKDFVNNVNIKNVPWLYEKYIQQFKYSNT